MKHQPKFIASTRNGSTLVIVMSVMIIIAIVAASMLFISRTQAKLASRSSDHMRAKVIAEAGANTAYNLIKTNLALAAIPANFPLTPYAGGSYDADLTVVASNRVSITCVGVYGAATAQSKVDVVNIPIVTTNGCSSPARPWDCGLFCNGYVRLNGSSTVRGSIHVNNYIDVNGSLTWGSLTNPVYIEASGANGFKTSGGGTIHGTVRAPAIDFAGSITTRRVESVPTMPMPRVSLDAFYSTAVSNGQVFGATTISGKQNWGTIPGGVRWYNGTLLIKNNGEITYTGCVIATGGIIVQGGCRMTRYGTMPSLVSRDSSIEFSGAQTTYGLIYAQGDITFNGSGYHQGTIISGGNMVFGGSATLVIDYAFCEPGVDAPVNSSVDRAYISAWQE